jgi:hypothetical protein
MPRSFGVPSKGKAFMRVAAPFPACHPPLQLQGILAFPINEPWKLIFAEAT